MTHFGNDLLRGMEAQTGHFRKPLDCGGPEQTSTEGNNQSFRLRPQELPPVRNSVFRGDDS